MGEDEAEAEAELEQERCDINVRSGRTPRANHRQSPRSRQ